MLTFIIVSFLIALGFLMTLVPVIPGTLVAYGGIVLHKLALGDASISWGLVGVATLLTLFTLVVDLACTWWGARRFGATTIGAIGALIGGIVGLLLFNVVGLLIGPVLGAIIFELLQDREGPAAVRAGFGTVVGSFVAYFLKLGLTIFMVAGFYLALLA